MTFSFHKPSIKLAGLYLGVIMLISLFFSINVYQLSVQEFDRGLREAARGIATKQIGFDGVPNIAFEQFQAQAEAKYQSAKRHVLVRLWLINAIIFVGGGIAAYALARWTLEPIEEAHGALERFTADASHELRTPLAIMRTEIEVALMNPKLTLSQAKAQLSSNLEELGKLTALSEGLLRLARLGRDTMPLVPTGLDPLLQEAVARVLPAAEAKRMLLTAPEKTDFLVMGDGQSLVEAFVTVLDNAVKYSPEKTEVAITAAREHHQIVVRITDHGPGIKATELPYIFERFYRADTARNKDQSQGYGLGLSIAKNIIGLHRGRISVASTPGKGSTFAVIVPEA